jgi:5-methyltetrahydrofolate--homocysteine methyltransferase
LSGFLTLAYDPMKETVAALKEAGLKDVKVMIGGGQIDEQIRNYTGADAFGRDAMMAVSLAKQWVGG